MAQFGSSLFEGTGVMRKKRSQTARRPRPEAHKLHDDGGWLSLLTRTSSDLINASCEETGVCVAKLSKKVFNLNQCSSSSSLFSRVDDGYSTKTIKENGGANMLNCKDGLGQSSNVESDKKLKKVKLKLGGVTRTIQAKYSSYGGLYSGSNAMDARPSDTQHLQKPFLQDSSDKYHSPPLEEKICLQGTAGKESPGGRFSLQKKPLMGKISGKNAAGKNGDKSDPIRKGKRVPKKRVWDEDIEEENDDEIRYLEKLKTSKASSGYKYFEEESSKKQRNLFRMCKVSNYDTSESNGHNRLRQDKASEEMDYDKEEETVSGCNPEDERKKHTDSLSENKKEISLTMRQRALLSRKDTSSVPGASRIEFPNGLPPLPTRKPKEKLSETELQLKKAEAAQRRRMQNDKAAQQLETEAIRKILGQDSNRKKREDKAKKQREELAQKKAANAQLLASSTIRWNMGPNGTVVTFPEAMGLPHIFDHKPHSYPPPREKCASPLCTNPFKYRDSKSKLPLCSLQCYKAIHEKMMSDTAC